MRICNLFSFVATLVLAGGMMACNTPDDPAPTPVENEEFEFKNITSDYTSFSLDILPADDTMEYIVFMSEVDYFTSNNILTAESLIEDDVLYFREYAAANNMNLREFLTRVGWLVSGDKIDYRGINLTPATDYVVYCYGIEFDGDYYSVVTDVCYTVVRTTAPVTKDVKFDVECNVDGNLLSIDVAPQGGYDGLYYIYIANGSSAGYTPEGSSLSEENISAMRSYVYKLFKESIDGDGKDKNKFCYRGEAHVDSRLSPDTNYMVAVFAVSDDMVPIMCSQPVVTYAHTGDVLLSDMTFDIDITDITPYTAQFSVTPSIEGEPYAAVFVSGETLDSMPADEVSLMYAFIDYFAPAIFDTSFSDIFTPLMPDTEYAFVVFGCSDGHPTSHITIERFTTIKAVEGTNQIRDIVIHKVWDVEEIVALDASYAPLAEEADCLVLAEAVVDDASCPVRWWWYEGYAREECTDEAFLEDLLLYDATPTPEVFALWYDFEIFFAGVAEDADGNLGDIYYGEKVILTHDDCSDAQEYLDMVHSGELPIAQKMLCR